MKKEYTYSVPVEPLYDGNKRLKWCLENAGERHIDWEYVFETPFGINRYDFQDEETATVFKLMYG